MGFYNYDTSSFRGYCVLCGNGFAKRDLDRVLCRKGSYGSPRTMAYVCRSCMSKVADFLGVELPDMDKEPNYRKPNYPFCPKCSIYGMEGDRFCRKCGSKMSSRKDQK